MPFAKGQSGNPGGRPKDKPFADALRMELMAAGADHRKLRKIARALIAKAEDGDLPAIREIADRLDGKVVPAVDATEPQGDVIYHINTGIIRPGDGAYGVRLSGQGRLIEGERVEAEDAEPVEN